MIFFLVIFVRKVLISIRNLAMIAMITILVVSMRMLVFVICVDDYHDDIHHIACDYDVCNHGNALMNFNEHHGVSASCDLKLSWSELSCDQYLDQLPSCLSSACPTLR